MKKFLGTILLAFLTSYLFAQTAKSPVKGHVSASRMLPVAGAIVAVGSYQTTTDDQGNFDLGRISQGNYTVTVSSLGYRGYSAALKLTGNAVQLDILLVAAPLYLQPLEVKSVRASERAPFAKTNIGKAAIEKTNLGQDIPFLLNQAPSVVVNSDAGNGVGYTGIRVRGSDATRINVTLNGIPYNDFESLGTYFVDLPDFASSVSSIQLQRGVGTSTNGAGAFGATLNLATNEYNEKAYGELNNSFGSFNTWKNTIKAGSGLLGDHFTLDARLSRISSDGYIERASTELKSYYLSAAYINQRSSLRFNIFSGKEKTYQAWYGVPETELAANRRINPAGTEKTGAPYDNQTDNYTQTHYQLFFNHAFSSRWSFNTGLFLTRGKGYYEEYKADQAYSKYGLPNVVSGGIVITRTDLVRQRWLDNYFYGQIASLQYKTAKDELVFGGGWTKYDGKHYGNIAWLKTGTVSKDYRYYDYPATKSDLNLYTKWQHEIAEHWLGFADLQYRHVNHNMKGFEGSPALNVNRSFDFVNPKAGFTYHNNGLQAYASFALGHKEPNRDDFQASPASQPKAETLHDFEIGIEQTAGRYFLGANIYYMNYVNQLVLTGQINDVGSYTRINIPKSYRLGIELQGSVNAESWLKLGANLAISRNKIRSFTEYIDNYDNGGQNAIAHSNTDISFSPAMVGGATITVIPAKQFEISFLSKYVGKQYMDNTQNESRKLNAFFTEDLRVNWTVRNLLFKELSITGQLNNILNRRYEPNGYTYSYIYNATLSTDNGYYPMAGTNFMLGLNIKF
jgi:iron complex outermembrane receptor protein